MTITGKLFIAGNTVQTSKTYRAINPVTNKELETEFSCADETIIDQACKAAFNDFDAFRSFPIEERAKFLEAIADNIESLGNQLVTQTMLETGLPEGRVKGETNRTVNQLRLFAKVVREREWEDIRLDPALPDRKPMARPDLRQRHIAIGPVVVFGASNFPLAFSVAGGDTASAFAAGCPVIVKVHPSHPGTSELIAQAIIKAIRDCHLPKGIFSLIGGPDHNIGRLLVQNKYICAVGFTGSQAGGMALVKLAAERPVPIPVFAEMGSINPVFLLDHALQNRTKEIAKTFVASLSMSAGQLCTNPGLILIKSGKVCEHFLETVKQELTHIPTSPMLNASIFQNFSNALLRLEKLPDVTLVGKGQKSPEPNQCQTTVYRTNTATFLNTSVLSEEIFGAAALIVTYDNQEELNHIVEKLEGQLTFTFHLDPNDAAIAQSLLPSLERKAGRILVNGWPTGVEVCSTMVHGGPFPATSDSRMTSVGTSAIRRFLRPVCYQNFPSFLLPAELQNDSISGINHRVNGSLIKK